MSAEELWKPFSKYYLDYPDIGLSLDIKPNEFFRFLLQFHGEADGQSVESMSALEKGAICQS